MGDQFDQTNFDPIAYLNNHFPDEQSLIGLDDEILKLNNQLTNVNKQLIQQIHQHAMINIEISDEIKKAKVLSKEIISQIGIIKDKAKKSQEIVYDMCKDLKSLDIAKKNLTFSIDALKKFIMMVDALQKLRQACQHQEYLEVANLLSAFNQLSNHFKKYQQIPQIQDLYKQKNAIVEELYTQLTEDFQQFYQGPTHLTEKNMEAAAKVIQGLGQEYWLKFSKWINHMILKQYEQQYDTPQALVLQNTQRRYGFIKRKMQDFATKFGHIIPIEWGADCRLLYEFCSVTRLHLTKTLQKTSHNVNIAILMKSMQFSIKFQNKITQLMFKKYQQLLKRKNKQQNDLQLIPKFIGSISNSFQPYLKPYIKSQQDSLLQALRKSIEQDKLTQIKVYNSSIVLFHGIKNSIRRASSYSKGNLMLEILLVIKKILKIYSQKCFEKNKKNQQHFEENICWIINTAQYCKSMIQGVQQCFESSIDPNRGQNIDFSVENQLFSNLISKSIELFISTLDQKLELILNSIHKTQWQKMTQMDVDISSYVRELKQLLLNNFLKIKDQLQSLYLTLYLDKIVVLTANKFIQNIYKCKKLNSQAFQVLHVDITEIKAILSNLVKTDKRTYSNPKTMQKYITFVNKTFIKGQNMIKLMKLDNEQFAQKFEILMQGVGVAQLEKMLQVKGAKKSDFPHLVQSLENKNL